MENQIKSPKIAGKNHVVFMGQYFFNIIPIEKRMCIR